MTRERPDFETADADRLIHPDAPPGKAAKYALAERERRFLLRAVPNGIPVGRVLIEDRYLVGTRLRLRQMTDLDGPENSAIYKLTQKIPTPAGTPGLITTIYLSATEYAALIEVPARTLRKVRSSFPPLGVDVFEGPLRGLILAEAEFDGGASEAAFQPPSDLVAEVTADVRFTGGAFVKLGRDGTTALLAEFGIAS